jgi:hypothetical protein
VWGEAHNFSSHAQCARLVAIIATSYLINARPPVWCWRMFNQVAVRLSMSVMCPCVDCTPRNSLTKHRRRLDIDLGRPTEGWSGGQLGFCVDRNGVDVNDLVRLPPNPRMNGTACLAWCQQQIGATACEAARLDHCMVNIWCSAHFSPAVDHGNGAPEHYCWVPIPNMATYMPTLPPTAAPTQAPTQAPNASPTQIPTHTPTTQPTSSPTTQPTAAPTQTPTQTPTTQPTSSPTTQPTDGPVNEAASGSCGPSMSVGAGVGAAVGASVIFLCIGFVLGRRSVVSTQQWSSPDKSGARSAVVNGTYEPSEETGNARAVGHAQHTQSGTFTIYK